MAPDCRTRRLSATLLGLIAAQYLIGVLTLIYRLPVSLAVLHQAMAAVIVAVWMAWMHHAMNLEMASSERPRTAPSPVAQSA